MFSREPKLAQGPSASFSLTGTSHPCIVRLRNNRAIAAASILLAFLFYREFVVKSFRMRTCGQTPCFAGFWPKSPAHNSFVFRTYRKPHP
jgi:hypothetical protein